MSDLNDIQKQRFIEELSQCGSVSTASLLAGYKYTSSVYAMRRTDEDFAQAWQDALDVYADVLEKEAFRRAVVGIEKPLAYQGQFTYVMARGANGKVIYDMVDEGEVDKDGGPKLTRTPRYKLDENGQPVVVAIREYSDSILLAMLKAKKPQEYRDNTKIELANAPGETFKTEETPIQSARKIAFALALGLRNVEKGEDLG